MNKVAKGLLVSSLLLSPGVALADDWQFGLGTGLYRLEIDGDTGFNTRLRGPVEFDASMDSDEVADVMESGAGINVIARNGDWTIVLGHAQLELQDDVKGNVGAVTAELDVTFEGSSSELSAEYTFAKSGDNTFGVLFGAVRTSQEYTAEISGAGATFEGTAEDDWVDVIVGFTHSYAINSTTIWSSRVDVGSEGRRFFNTGVTWILTENWSTRLYASATQYDYEEGSEGDDDWYMYDATESGFGLGVAYMF